MAEPRLSGGSLPRAERCPASATLPRTGQYRESAERGKAMHAEKEAENPDGAEVAFALNVLTGEARQLPADVDRSNLPRGPGEVVGILDRITIEPHRVVIRDYKSGFGFGVAPPAENLQLAFYAVAAARVHRRSAARVEIEYLDRDGAVVGADLDALDLAAAFARIRAIYEAASRPSPAVVTGDHCSMCPCIARCPAYTTLALAVAQGVLPADGPVLEISPATVASGWPRIKAFKKLLGEVERAYRAYAAMEPVRLPNGKWLGQVQKPEDEIDGAVAMKVLRELHGVEVAATAVEIATSKAGIERGIALVAPRGKKAALVRAALDRIATEGGVTRRFKTTVEEYEDESPAQTGMEAAHVREG